MYDRRVTTNGLTMRGLADSYVNTRNGVDSKGGNLQNPAIKTTPYVLLFLNQSFF